MTLDRDDFAWRGLDLCLARRKTPVLALVADPNNPHLYCIQYPNGWTSTPANLTRAKDAAYSHARHLVGGQASIGPAQPQRTSWEAPTADPREHSVRRVRRRARYLLIWATRGICDQAHTAERKAEAGSPVGCFSYREVAAKLAPKTVRADRGERGCQRP